MLLIRRHRLLLISFIFLAFIVTFRGKTRDTIVYKYVYENLEYMNLGSVSGFYSNSGMEIGYGYLSYIVSILFDDYRVVFFIISFSILYCLYKVSLYLRINIIVFFLVYITNYYFVMQQFMQIRQGLSTALVFYGALLFFNKKYYSSLGLFIIACLFHQTAFAFVFFFIGYLLTKSFFERYRGNLLVYISIIIGVILVCKSILFIIPDYFVRVASYTDSDYSQVLSPFRLTSLRFYLLFIFFQIFLCFFFKNKPQDNLYKNESLFLVFLLVTYAVGLGIRIGFNDFAILSTRLSEFFLFAEIFLTSFIFSYKRTDLKFLILFVLYLIAQIFILVNQLDYVFIDYFKEI